MLEQVGIVSFIFAIVSVAALVVVPRQQRYILIALINLLFSSLVFHVGALTFFLVATANFILFHFFSNSNSRPRHRIAFAGLGVSLLPLALVRWPSHFEWLEILLPVSLCFFSLQQIGMWADLIFQRATVPRSYLVWLSYALFFPAILSGPISRWGEMSEQLENPKPFERAAAWDAVALFLQASFKMTVFAIPLQKVLEIYFLNPMTFGPIATIVLALFFRFYIWAELSSRTDWARAMSSMFGINLPRNFDRPFQQKSLSDFWRHWHMTLSLWLRDYIFLPLAMGPLRRIFSRKVVVACSLLLTFSVFGLWHGLSIGLLAMGVWKGIGVLVTEWPSQFLVKSRFWLVREASARILFYIAFVLFVGLPTLLLRLDLDVFVKLIHSNLLMLVRGDDRWIASLGELFAPITNPDASNAKLFIWLGAVLIWQILEYLSPESETSPEAMAVGTNWPTALRSAVIISLFAIWILVGGFGSEFKFSYAN